MSSDQRSGLWQRLFGLGGGAAPEKTEAVKPAKKAPPKPKPAPKEPLDRKRPAKKAGTRAKKSVTPKGQPPAGPVLEPGAVPPEEGSPGTRAQGSPVDADRAAPDAGAAAPGAGPEDDDRTMGSAAGETRGPSWFAQLRQGLARTSAALGDNLTSALSRRKFDEETLDELEEALIKADLGIAMASRIRSAIAAARHERGLSPQGVREVLAAEIAKVLAPVAEPFKLAPDAHPHVILLVGVNGTGKTTTAAKMARQFMRADKSVMLAAADTFRAAAIDQLKVWGKRVGAEVVAKEVGADPAGVAYEAFERARAEGRDVLIIDTAGRLQNKSDLMAELAKIVRVLKKLDPEAPHSVVLVLDATTGQNALNQVQIFQEIAGVTSLVLTKLDGTARGGILVAIAERFGLPVNAIGVGEGVDDLQAFDAQDFAGAIAGVDDKNAAAA